jgi:hypothetical protein
MVRKGVPLMADVKRLDVPAARADRAAKRASRKTSIIETACVLTLSLVALAAPIAPSAAADSKALTVNWNDPELKGFAQERAAGIANGANVEEESKLTTLHIPVLAFERPPEAVTRNLRAGPEAEPERAEHFDEANPVWYQIVEDYGDVTVSIEADLRVQHTFDASHPVYDKAVPGAAVSDEPQVSVMDENGEEGMEGSIAEYTFTRFGVPYTVTVECTAAAKEQCKDTAQLAKDSALLKVVGGQAP